MANSRGESTFLRSLLAAHGLTAIRTGWRPSLSIPLLSFASFSTSATVSYSLEWLTCNSASLSAAAKPTDLYFCIRPACPQLSKGSATATSELNCSRCHHTLLVRFRSGITFYDSNLTFWLVVFVVVLVASYYSDKYTVRGPFVSFFGLLGVIGYAINLSTSGKSARYGALFLQICERLQYTLRYACLHEE